MEHEPKDFVCPKCYTKNPEPATECSCCGIVFAKYKIAKILWLDEALNEYKKNNFTRCNRLFFSNSDKPLVQQFVRKCRYVRQDCVVSFKTDGDFRLAGPAEHIFHSRSEISLRDQTPKNVT